MTRRITVLLALAGFITCPGLALARQETPEGFRYETSMSGVLMQPRGDFDPALRTIGYGGGLHLLIPIASGPLSVGADGQLLFYPPAEDRRRHSMMVTLHGLLRAGRRSGPRRPYAEIFGGLKQFSTETRIGTFSYGVGAGLQFPRGRRIRDGELEHLLLEVGVRYLRGGGARVDGRTLAPSTHSIMLHVGMVRRF
jgi:hypothetical protein